MRIASVDIHELNIPFEDGGERFGLKPPRWDRFDTVLVRVTAENGLIGWGECFSYGCQSAVTAAMREMVVPLLIGHHGREIAPVAA